jgi:predicted phosphodiesterase
MNAFITLKTTALAPMANASVKTAVMVNPGDLRNWRKENRRSCSRVVMGGLQVQGQEEQFERQSAANTTY